MVGILLPPTSVTVTFINFMMSRPCRRYVFTLNNPTPEELLLYEEHLASDIVKYAVYGNETGESGTPHLQGFVIYARPQRFSAARGLLPRSHLEAARGTSKQCRDYCVKDGDFREFGEFPGRSGQRSDLSSFFEWGDQFASDHGAAAESPDVAMEQPIAYVRYPRVVRALFHRQPAPVLQEGALRPWQQELEELLLTEPDDRTVLFYVDNVGNQGKSWFCRFMVTKYPSKVQLMGPGKLSDMAFTINTSRSHFLFNVPRSQMEHLQYAILEQLKDRVVFSSKYQSITKVFRHCNWVVVFCNESPDLTKMSVDRYVIKYL